MSKNRRGEGSSYIHGNLPVCLQCVGCVSSACVEELCKGSANVCSGSRAGRVHVCEDSVAARPVKRERAHHTRTHTRTHIERECACVCVGACGGAGIGTMRRAPHRFAFPEASRLFRLVDCSTCSFITITRFSNEELAFDNVSG